MNYIRTERLFVIAVVLKFSLAFASVYFGSPWMFGFYLPLSVMIVYILLGKYRSDTKNVSDEKFADSCYYLGFIFTITSICACLIDINSIGTDITNIAIRFGAAMVSTVLGLAVRVWLVTFRKESFEAVEDAGAAIIKASYALVDQLSISKERFRKFDEDVFIAAQQATDRVNLQIEAIAKNYAAALDGLFKDINEKHQTQLESAIASTDESVQKLEALVTRVGQAVGQIVINMQKSAVDLVDGIQERMRSSEFPGDYFVRMLTAPMRDMQEAAGQISSNVKDVASGISSSTNTISNAFKRLEKRSAEIDTAMESVLSLAKSQEHVLQATSGQLDSLTGLSNQIGEAARLLNEVSKSVDSSDAQTRQIATALEGMARQMAESARSAQDTVVALRQTVQSNTQTAEVIQSTAAAQERLSDNIQLSSTAQAALIDELRAAGGQSIAMAEKLAALITNLDRLTFLPPAPPAPPAPVEMQDPSVLTLHVAPHQTVAFPQHDGANIAPVRSV